MKKVIISAAVLMALMASTSCSTVKKTSTTQDVATELTSDNTAGLAVSNQKISFYYKVPKSVRRGGNKSIIATAVSEALKANGNADVMVHMQYDARYKRGKIREITVTGYPAAYKNFKEASR